MLVHAATQQGCFTIDFIGESVLWCLRTVGDDKEFTPGINFKEEQNRTLCEINQNLSHILPYIHSSPQVTMMDGGYIWIRYRI